MVTFQEAASNIDNHFNLATNQFTCHIPGTYVFTFTIGVHQNIDIFIALVKNGQAILKAHSRSNYSNNYVQDTNIAILNLETGDQVWLQFTNYEGRKVHSDSNRQTSFSGFLLYEA